MFIFTLILCLISGIVCFDVKDQDNSLSPECKSAIRDDVLQCKQISLDKWNSNKIIIKFAKSTCCSAWDIIDCLEKFVKERCPDELKKVQLFYLDQVCEGEKSFCRDYPYYSTKCTITDKEIKPETSDVDRDKLLTTVRLPSNNCQDLANKAANPCSVRVIIESGFNQAGLKNNKTMVECCIKYKLMDCMLDVAKGNETCSHQDVNGLIDIYDKIEAGMMVETCIAFPKYSEQCNSSFKLKYITASILMVMFVFGSF